MKTTPAFAVFTGLTLAGSAMAQCHMAGSYFPSTTVENDTSLCEPQGAGMWTFSMSTSLVDVPEPGRTGAGTGSTVSSNGFQIMDNDCVIRSGYSPPSCGVPWVVEESFLADVLTVTTVSMDVGSPYFSFTYGNGVYSINNNQCGCSSANNGLEAGQNCKCAFPVSGVGSSRKRDVNVNAVAFEA